MEIALNRMIPGSIGSVTQIGCSERMKSRLRSFGLVPGTRIGIRYKSPDGGVTAIELRDTVIALRTCELKKIRVRVL